ncbi:DUF5050 domain-containing protein [Cohnella sp.]|uniref:DUF5050 domain-containing protein n=1 Tax=Cohnella sp. TaxID=1883426 RepID=UPI003568E636
MKNFVIIMFICVGIVCGTLSAYAAGESDKKPLNEVFDHMVIVPYDYQGKAFINGQKTDVFEDYQMVQRNGRVLVPIRLMGYLADQSNPHNNSMWATIWQPQKPDEVLLTNSKLNKTIKFTVNSKTMMVNNKPQTLDIAPQRINGRIVLPLRSASEALDKKIEWLDGLILISDEYVDLQHPQTLAIKDQIKAELSDTRKRVDYQKTAFPITKYGNIMYYFKRDYNHNGTIDKMYKKADGQKEVQVQLPGTLDLENRRFINDELYYVSMVNNKWELDVFNFANNKSRKMVELDQWVPRDGWLEDIKYIDNELYIILHYGDGTMGGETLYKVVNGTLKNVVYAKNFINYIKAGEYIYHTDIHHMSVGDDNLNRVDMKTGEVTSIGQPGYAYGIYRTIEDQGGIRFSGNGALYIKDDYLYTLGYKDSDPKDEGSVYKINLADQTQVKLTSAAKQFWIEDNKIYYIDSKTGYLGRVDLDGNNNQILVERKAGHVQFFNGSIYYNDNLSGGFFDPGELYRYDIEDEKEVKLSDKPVSSFFVGKAGVYYVSNGYDLGLYKIDAGGHNVRFVKDSIDRGILTDAGMVYTMTYKEGIYSVK